MRNDSLLSIREHLDASERLLWSGQPKQGVMFRGLDAFLIPFGLLWGGFAFFWEYAALTSGAPIVFCLFGVPFVIIGIYLIFGRFYVEAKQRENAIYGVTTDRVIIVSGLFQRKVQSLPLRTLSNVSLTESRDGLGSISFGASFPFASWFGSMAWPGMDQFMGPRFDTIDDAERVYQIIREAQRNAT